MKRCELCNDPLIGFDQLDASDTCKRCDHIVHMWLSKQRVAHDPPLQLNQRVHLHEGLYARFDGQTVIIENEAGTNAFLHLSPERMALVFWFNRRVVDSFPEQWAIDLSKLDD